MNKLCDFCGKEKKEKKITINLIELGICKKCYHWRESIKNDNVLNLSKFS